MRLRFAFQVVCFVVGRSVISLPDCEIAACQGQKQDVVECTGDKYLKSLRRNPLGLVCAGYCASQFNTCSLREPDLKPVTAICFRGGQLFLSRPFAQTQEPKDTSGRLLPPAPTRDKSDLDTLISLVYEVLFHLDLYATARR